MPRVLLVDHDPEVRATTKASIQDSFQVIETGDATEALGLALEHKPDCILLDLNLPKFSGLELCQTLMSVSLIQTTPIFIMAAQLPPDHQQRYRHLGATAFFEKPLDIPRVKRSLAAVLQGPRRITRSEPRIRLKVTLKLRGTADTGKQFELVTSTDDVSGSGFCCRCTLPLKQDTLVEVSLLTHDSEHLVGHARMRHTAWLDTPWQACGFQFISKKGPWIL
jgi:CheY-like chemotaxis protein